MVNWLIQFKKGKNATAFGRGVYFAKNSSYSHGYTDKRSGKVKGHMFLANVLVGSIAQGNSSISINLIFNLYFLSNLYLKRLINNDFSSKQRRHDRERTTKSRNFCNISRCSSVSRIFTYLRIECQFLIREKFNPNLKYSFVIMLFKILFII